MSKKKILIGHPYWGRGGAEVSAMWLLEALKDHYAIYLVTRGGWNLKELNEVAQTSISNSDVKLIQMPLKGILANTIGGNIWHAFFLRYCRYIAGKFDIRITASRTIGWGLPAIHFLSDVVWNRQLNQEYGERTIKKNLIKRIVAKIGEKLAGKGMYGLHPKDIFVANSHFTQNISGPYTTTKPIVIYPAVTQNFREIIWKDRKNEFVCLGRISPEKKIEDAITIIEKLRKQGYNICLTIFGQFDMSEYSNTIKELIKDKIWINAPGPIYGDEKSTILPTFKYGINTCQREAFGISTAEMMKSGIIPFVPVMGAQFEIINHDDLVFENLQDAVIKIVNVLNSEIQQQNLISHLNKQMLKFSAEEFKCRILGLLSNIGNE